MNRLWLLVPLLGVGCVSGYDELMQDNDLLGGLGGQDDYDAGTGTWIIIPPGAPHTFANVGDEPAVMLTTFTPDLYVHYFREIKALVDSGQPMTRETMAPIWKNYATEPSTEFAP